MNTPDISDQYPEIPFLHGYKPFGNYHSLAGEIETILCPDDNSLVRPLLSSEGNGKILFIDGQVHKMLHCLEIILQRLQSIITGVELSLMVL